MNNLLCCLSIHKWQRLHRTGLHYTYRQCLRCQKVQRAKVVPSFHLYWENEPKEQTMRVFDEVVDTIEKSTNGIEDQSDEYMRAFYTAFDLLPESQHEQFLTNFIEDVEVIMPIENIENATEYQLAIQKLKEKRHA